MVRTPDLQGKLNEVVNEVVNQVVNEVVNEVQTWIEKGVVALTTANA